MPRLADATLDAWRATVELAIAERVAFVLVAGDIFDADARTIRGPLAFIRGLRALADAGIGAFVVAGHADPLGAWEPSLAMPEGTVRFGADAVGIHPVIRDGQEVARIHGISHDRAGVTDDLAARFRVEPGSPFAIGLLHASVGDRPGAAPIAPCTIETLVASGIEYWALGHDHRPSVLDVQRPAIVYPGSPQGLDLDEAGARGPVLVTVDEDGTLTTELRPVDAIRIERITVDPGGTETPGALEERIAAAVESALASAGRPIVARIELDGVAPVHAALARPGSLEALADALDRRFIHRHTWAWIEGIDDRSRSRERVDPAPAAAELLGELDRVAGETGAALRDGLTDPAGVRAALDSLLAEPGLRAAIGEPGPDALDEAIATAWERASAELEARA